MKTIKIDIKNDKELSLLANTLRYRAARLEEAAEIQKMRRHKQERGLKLPENQRPLGKNFEKAFEEFADILRGMAEQVDKQKG